MHQFLAKPAEASSSKDTTTSRSNDVIDMTGLDAPEDPADEHEQTGEETPGQSPDTELDPSPQIGGPVCPICNRNLGPETSNADLNEHIDLCLNRDAFSAELTPSPKKRSAGGNNDHRPTKKGKSKASSKGKGSVLDWLKRG